MRNYRVYHGRDINWLKNDKEMCRAIYKDEACKWMINLIDFFNGRDQTDNGSAKSWTYLYLILSQGPM